MKNLIEYSTIQNPENLHLCFMLDNSTYALNAQNIIEITTLPLINTPQKLSEYVLGILNYNDMFINIIDIRKIFTLPQRKYKLSNKVIIIKGDESLFAIIVDEVTNFFTSTASETQKIMGENCNSLLSGFYKLKEEVVNLIDLAKIEQVIKKSQGSENSTNYTDFFPQDEESFCLLQKRKNEIATPPQFHLNTDVYGKDQYIIFEINNHTYCLYSLYVKELITLKNYPITHIPYTPEFIKGIINLKGNFYTVIDLKTFINLNENFTDNNKSKQVDKKIIVIESTELKIAFLVDNIVDIINIPNDFIQIKNDMTLDDLFIKAEACINNKTYNIFNIDKLINDKRIYVGSNN